MAVKNKPIDKFTQAAIALIVVVVLYFAYTIAMGLRSPVITTNSSLGIFKTVNSATINTVKELTACGNWPIIAPTLSAGRGNPFSRKGEAPAQMVAVPAIYCLPVTQ